MPGSTILLIQSGAIYPDGPMVAELGKHFSSVPFSVGNDGPVVTATVEKVYPVVFLGIRSACECTAV
jgi:hypothetical protein